MRIDGLCLQNFRNYAKLQITLDPNVNIFVGANAQGKTNLLEAVAFLSSLRSFRTKSEEELVSWGEKKCCVTGDLSSKQTRERLCVTYNAGSRKKEFSSNGVSLTRSEYAGRLIPVIFTPEDLAIVKGPPQLRRKYLDEELVKIFPVYEYELTRYNHIVRQRNQLLKTYRERILGSVELESWNEHVALQGAKILHKRFSAIHRISLLARLTHRSLTGTKETLEVVYLPSVSVGETDGQAEMKEALLRSLKEKGREEARFGQTLAGPHRDDLSFNINGKNARLYASQGQQRTLILALKLAELEYIRGETGEFPLLLFDDVFSELDEKRRCFLLEAIDGRIQTFITGTEAEKIGTLKKAGRLFCVDGGEVR